MARRDIAARVRAVIVAELRCTPAKVCEDAEFGADLGATSLDKIGIVSAIEDAFGILLSDREVAFCETVGTAIDLIETKVENRSAGGTPRFSTSLSNAENRRVG